MSSTRKFVGALSLSVLVMGGLGLTGGALSPLTPTDAASPAKPQTQTTPTARALPDFSGLVKQYGPAVVNISTTAKARMPAIPGLEPGHPLYEFFRQFGGQVPQGDQIRQGVGSGFIVTQDGYILTNAHVVAEATEVTVRLTDKREFKAKVIGSDQRTDIALVKIEAKALPTVRIGDPEKAQVGEWVAAIGSPFGLENSVTAGIISAKARSLSGESLVPFIQTDVAVNPGNSGGPLFTMNGEVIGINSQIYSRTGGYMGLSFAVPIDVAMKVKEDLQKFGKVSRGRLGISIQSVSAELAESFGLAKPQGALVTSVEPGSAAQKAGIATGDIILAVNNRNVEEAGDLARTIAQMKPGSNVALKVWRKGATRELRASLGEVPPENVAQAGESPSAGAQGKLGLAVRPLRPEERKQLSADGGVMVESATGPAARAGIRPGDVILALNDTPVKSVEDLRRLADKAKGNVALLVQRQEGKIYVPLKIG
ncbi:MAG: peptidase [Betaproteobacteria bacterium RIFCSPLOWO2_02_FULL_65_24]|nr:MAG: peptidase [Betaproteobacteria bacterium RIFCSPLOWO2_02_FULL_65_24]OGA88543.1 MAG: peptidase [Betaproteobacteria bacterium RIFCSPLOWO2_12_FULL_66_14]